MGRTAVLQRVDMTCLRTLLVVSICAAFPAACQTQRPASIFEVVPTPDPQPIYDNDLYAVGASSPADIWAVGSTAIHFDGTSWTGYALPGIDGVIGAQLKGVAVLSPTNAWGVGSFLTNGPTTGNLQHWDGSAWSAVPNPANAGTILESIAAVSADDIWAGSCVVGPFEHFDGTAWTAVPTPPTQPPEYCIEGIAVVSTSDIWAVGWQGDGGYNSVTLTMHWDGARWTTVASPSVGNGANQLNGVVAVASDNVWAVGFSTPNPTGSGTDPNRTLIEHWDGTNWTVVTSPNVDYGNAPRDNILQAVVALSADDLWGFGYLEANPSGESGDIFGLAVHWDGTSWTVAAVPEPNQDPALVNDPLYGGVVTGPGTVWAVGAQQLDLAKPHTPPTGTLVLYTTGG
jgi:hypothetical protein